MCMLLLAFAPCASMAQSGSTLLVEIKTPKTRLHLGGRMQMTVVLRNTGAQQSVVLRGDPGFSAAGGMELVVIDGQGVSHSLPPTSGDMTLEQAQAGTRRVVLPPGHGHAVYRQAHVQTFFPAVGRYQIRVNYRSPLPSAGNPSVVPSAVEGSEASSTPVAIEVVE